MRAFAVGWMLLFIIVMTITNIGIDKEFNLLKWLGNAMILFGIAVFGLFIGESMGVDRQKEKTIHKVDDNGNPTEVIVGGLYQKNLYEYNVFRKAIDDLVIYFPLFYDWFVPQRLESKQINYLVMNNIKHGKASKIVKYCTLEDFADLKEHPIEKEIDGKQIIIPKLEEREYEPVEEILKGIINLELSGTAYYLQAFAESNQKDIIEQGEAFRKARRYNKKSNRAVRLISGAFISLAIGLLTVNDLMKGNDAQAWVNLITRIANLFTAIFSGWISGAVDVKLEAESIGNKTDVLRLFKSAYDKKLFPMYDEEEADKKEWEQYQKEKEEAKANVVEPEVAESNIMLLPNNDI